ncbi:MAG: DUF885 domain-containing protein [Halieaceae bacterium]
MRAILFSLAILLATLGCADSNHDFELIIDDHWDSVEEEKVMFRRDPDSWRLGGELASVTAESRSRREAFNEGMLERLAAIDEAGLSDANRISYRVFLYEREAEAESYSQLDHLYPITNRSGWHNYFASAPADMTISSKADYEGFLLSLEDFPRYNAEHIALLQEAVDKGQTQFCESMTGFEDSISGWLVDDVTTSAFYQPLANIPSSIAEPDRIAIEARGRQLIEEGVLPAYRDFYEFYTSVYAPACRRQEGITTLPGGEDYYAYAVRYYTTTDMTPLQIHDLGLAEVERIKLEMDTLIEETGFEGSFAEFLQFLRTDPQFYVTEPEDLLEKASRIAKRMDGQLPRLFATIPRLPYDIKEIAASVAPKTTGAYYSPAPGDGRTPGSYYLNTYKLDSRPLYTLEALTFHEAVPGHHLQMALALELDVPEFRRLLYHSAFGEGWALYTERLGLETGFYTDPYSDFGRLTYEMWRACRLVVDTGMHAFGWTRQQAIDYMAQRTALSIHEVTSEVDRYITWPAQALSYKIGELKIRELRARGEAALGDQFDLRQFHDVVIGNGSIPIAVLESVVLDWINAQQAKLK